MSHSYHVEGIVPPDDRWKKHKAIWDACKSANVQPPPETYNFFNGEPPSNDGVIVDLRKHECVRKVDMEMCEGFVVDLTKLPPHIKGIRSYTCY